MTTTTEHLDAAKTAVQAECNQVLDAFMEALNAHDSTRMDACMHFPHIRFAENSVKVYDAAGSNPMDLFTRLQADDGWSYSRWESHRSFSTTRARRMLRCRTPDFEPITASSASTSRSMS